MSYIQFLGAAGTVTGSKHLINTSDGTPGGGPQILIDCGLFQGQKEWRERNWQPLPTPARSIAAVILTHAHLDHCGWIPRLIKEGFAGPVYATPSTIDLCAIVLPDSGHLQEEDAAFHNKMKSSRHKPALPLYTADEAKAALERFRPVDFGQTTQVTPNLSFRFVHAAHILGAAMVELTIAQNGGSRQLLFTGDLGRVQDTTYAPGKVVHHSPQQGESADLLVMESTYGNRLHPKTDPRPQLADAINQCVHRGGSVIVPAFAVERTQKFLFVLKELMEQKQIPRLPVFCDSPMAIHAVEVFLNHTEEFNQETRDLVSRYGSPLTWDGFNFCRTPQESKKINDTRYPCLIVSSNGMCMGGRIQHHLAQRLPDPRNLVLFIGFQAPGTRGAQLKDHAPQVKIYGQIVPVRSQITAIEQFSDHADTPEILSWLHTFQKAPATTWLVHGEPDSATQLRAAIVKDLNWQVEIAKYLEKAPLP